MLDQVDHLMELVQMVVDGDVEGFHDMRNHHQLPCPDSIDDLVFETSISEILSSQLLIPQILSSSIWETQNLSDADNILDDLIECLQVVPGLDLLA